MGKRDGKENQALIMNKHNIENRKGMPEMEDGSAISQRSVREDLTR